MRLLFNLCSQTGKFLFITLRSNCFKHSFWTSITGCHRHACSPYLPPSLHLATFTYLSYRIFISSKSSYIGKYSRHSRRRYNYIVSHLFRRIIYPNVITSSDESQLLSKHILHCDNHKPTDPNDASVSLSDGYKWPFTDVCAILWWVMSGSDKPLCSLF